MLEKSDRLSNEIEISASITDSSLSLKTKSRAIAAADRLLGSFLDVPASYLEGCSERIRAKNEFKRGQSYTSMDDSRIRNILQGEIKLGLIDEKINKKHVLKIALENLNKQKTDTENEDALSEEWLSSFDRFAKTATTDRLRDVWGRVLAGEIMSPGKFSMATLRFISELDLKTARLFEKHALVAFSSDMIIKPNDLRNDTLKDLLFLEECGLLNQVGGTAFFEFDRKEAEHFLHREGDFVLKFTTLERASTFRLDIMFLTRISREVTTILPKTEPEILLRALAKNIAPRTTSLALLMIINDQGNGIFDLLQVEVLK